MASRSGLHLVAWIALAYLAAIVQIRWTDGPNAVLALAAAWLCRHPGSRGVLGVAMAGLSLDAVGNDRLGLHLGLCGLLAALTVTALSGGLTARWWMPPLIAAWLTFGDAAMTSSVLSATSSVPFDLSDTLRTAGWSALATGALVGGIILLGIMAWRCLSLPTNVSGVRLNNHWHRLTEA